MQKGQTGFVWGSKGYSAALALAVLPAVTLLQLQLQHALSTTSSVHVKKKAYCTEGLSLS
jgi:hypothetical protein